LIFPKRPRFLRKDIFGHYSWDGEVYVIDKCSAIPLYHQLVDEIAEQINTGRLAVRSKLPSERELCKIYGVSRTTVRQAIGELQRLGCVSCLHGKGNYVTGPIIRQPLRTIYSFSEEMQKLGKVPSTRLIGYQMIACDAKLAGEMGAKTGTPVYRIERLRLADDEPITLVVTYLLASRFPDFDCGKLSRTSLYTMMTEQYGLKLTEVRESLKAVSLSRSQALPLNAATGEAAMMISRKSFEGPLIVEYALGITRGDRFSYDVVLKNQPEANGI